jgi:hypothetical protein
MTVPSRAQPLRCFVWGTVGCALCDDTVRSSLSTGLVGQSLQTPKSSNPALARPDFKVGRVSSGRLGAPVRVRGRTTRSCWSVKVHSARHQDCPPGQQPPRFKHDRPGCPSRRTVVNRPPRHWQAAAAVTGSALTQSVGISGSASTTVSCTRRPLRLRLGNSNLT